MYGFEVREDDCMKCVYILGFKKDGKGTKGQQSCNTICSSERVTRRKFRGVCITAINDAEIVTLDQAKEKFVELRSKKVDSFTILLAPEPKPSKSMMQRACDKLELPAFDLDENLREDYFTLGEDQEGNSSLAPSHGTERVRTSCVSTIGTKISRKFGTEFYYGKVMSGPYIRTVNGDDIAVWEVRCAKDGDWEEMTASEIACWKAPVEEVHSSKLKSKPAKPKKTVATKLSGDWSEELEDALP